jgi:hypothetical protein
MRFFYRLPAVFFCSSFGLSGLFEDGMFVDIIVE